LKNKCSTYKNLKQNLEASCLFGGFLIQTKDIKIAEYHSINIPAQLGFN
jgi:hypothetical protein